MSSARQTDEETAPDSQKKSTTTAAGVEVPGEFFRRIWYDMDAGVRWRSMGLVPASADVNIDELVRSLAVLAAIERSERVELINGLGHDIDWGPIPSNLHVVNIHEFNELELHEEILPELEQQLRDGHSAYSLVLIAAPPAREAPHLSRLLRAATAWSLCIRLGQTHFGDARRTIAAIGKQQLLGTIVVKE